MQTITVSFDVQSTHSKTINIWSHGHETHRQGGSVLYSNDHKNNTRKWNRRSKTIYRIHSVRNTNKSLTSSDEIWLTSTDIKNDMESIRKLFDEKLPALSPILKVEGFQLKHLNAPHRTTVGFVKEYVDGRRPDFKKTYQTYFAQVFKHYFKLPVTPHDRVFIFDGFISSMDTYLY